jgi:parallel beta-helix repeat protein
LLNAVADCRITGLEFDAANNPTQLVFFDGGRGNSIEHRYLHDIQSARCPPYAAIHSQNTVGLRVANNHVASTAGIDGGYGVRGIWVSSQSHSIIGNNHVESTGHSGISFEGDGCVIWGNYVNNITTQGTGYKIVCTANPTKEMDRQFARKKSPDRAERARLTSSIWRVRPRASSPAGTTQWMSG